MTVRKIALFLLIAAGVAIPVTVLRAQSGAEVNAQGGILDVLEGIKRRQAEQLEGTWITEIVPQSPPGARPFRTYRTFARGGVLFISDRNRPLDGLQHGVWVHQGGNDYSWSVVQDRFDAQGNFLGTFTSRVNVTLIDRDTMVGMASVEYRDADGNLTLARCATTRSERFKLTTLPLQCAGVAPPQ